MSHDATSTADQQRCTAEEQQAADRQHRRHCTTGVRQLDATGRAGRTRDAWRADDHLVAVDLAEDVGDNAA